MSQSSESTFLPTSSDDAQHWSQEKRRLFSIQITQHRNACFILLQPTNSKVVTGPREPEGWLAPQATI